MRAKTKLGSSILIQIIYDTEKGKGSHSKLLSVSRIITVDGKEVYKDKMSPEMYIASEDPIKDLNNFLLGLKKTKDSKDVGSNSRNGSNFFQKIWRKLFGKKIQFIT